MKVLITGGAGFIGTHLRNLLVAEGHQVKILDNLLPQVHGDAPSTDFGDCEFVRGDVRDVGAVSDALKGVEIVYHLAAETGVGQSQYEIERYISTNTLGTAVVLQAAVSADVKQIIITSSRAVYGEGVHLCSTCGTSFVPKSRFQKDLDEGNWEILCPSCGNVSLNQPMHEDDPVSPISIYGLTKLQQEQIANQVSETYNVPVTSLRLFNVFGPGQSLSNPYVGVLGTFFRRIKSGNEIDIYEDGQMRRDFVYVGDVVDALNAAAGNEKAFNATFNVGSGSAVTLEQAGLEMFRLMNVEPQLKFSGKYRLGDLHHAVASVQKLRDALGYTPSTAFSAGLEQFVAWAQKDTSGDADIDLKAEALLKERNLLRQAQRKG